MKKAIILILILLSSLKIYSQNKSKVNSLLDKVSSKSENNDIKSILTDPKDNFIKNSIDVLLKDIQKINNECDKDEHIELFIESINSSSRGILR